MTLIDTHEHEGYTIEVHDDQDVYNPRTEYDNFGTLYLDVPRYLTGDQDADPSEIEGDKEALCMDVYAYIHGGVTIRTSGFSCPWDSGCAGCIYISGERIRKEFSIPQGEPIPDKVREQALGILQSEIDTYDDYLTGQVYGYVIKDPQGEELEQDGSLWGFFGDPCKSGLLDEAKSTIGWEIEHRRKTCRGEQLELAL